MFQFPTVQRMSLDLLCHFLIQPFLKHYLPSPTHIIKVLYYCIYFMEAWGPSICLCQVHLSHWSCTRDAFGLWGLKITGEIFTAYLCGTETTHRFLSLQFSNACALENKNTSVRETHLLKINSCFLTWQDHLEQDPCSLFVFNFPV